MKCLPDIYGFIAPILLFFYMLVFFSILPLFTLFCFASEKASHGYEANMAYYVEIRLSTTPHAKAGVYNPVGGQEFQ